MRFTVRRLMVAMAGIALILAAYVGFLEVYLDPYITVMVLNETGQPLNDVRVSWKGGERKSERIGPGEIATWRIKPYGLFDINLSYRNPKNSEITKHINLYHDIGYRYYIELHILKSEIKEVAEFGAYPRLPESP